MFNNVSQLLKLRALRNRFEKNHPKFFPFMKAAKTRALEEGSLIEISVTPPDGEMISTYLKVQASDLELLQGASRFWKAEEKNYKGKPGLRNSDGFPLQVLARL